MTSFQYYWTLLFIIGPSFYVSVITRWWYGIITAFVILLLHGICGWISVLIIPMKFLKYLAYLKAPVIAIIVIIVSKLWFV